MEEGSGILTLEIPEENAMDSMHDHGSEDTGPDVVPSQGPLVTTRYS